MTTKQLQRLLGLLMFSVLVIAGCSGGDDDGDTEVEDAAEDAEATADEAMDEAMDEATDEEAMDEEEDDEAMDEEEPADEGAAAEPGERVTIQLGQPESLTPINNTESEGSQVLAGVFEQLINYDAENNLEPMMANAESIETEDNQTYTVTLKEGWTFHDGTPVTADSYVNAWNYAAFTPNAQSVAGFFAPIAGYEDVQCGTVEDEEGEEVANCDDAPPAAETMSGLTVDSETQFTIELTEPEAFFITRLGYNAYSPLPEVFYDDPAAFDRMPIGNGPLMMASEWQDDIVIETDVYSDYAGDNASSVGVEFIIFADINTGVTDLTAGDLDIVNRVPPEIWEDTISQVPNSETYEDSGINYIGFPTYDDRFSDPQIRAALSMAIDRETITEGIFGGLREPAGNILSPVIPGYQETIDGCDNWTFNPELAAEMFEAAGGAELFADGLDVWFNEGGGHDLWVTDVVNQWEANLGISAGNVTFQQLPFAEYLELADGAQFTGPFRLGWGMDYPHPQNYLQILLELTAPEGGNNATFWTNDEYSATIAEALLVPDVEESLPLWEDAAALACSEAPVAPMFYSVNAVAWNDTVDGVFVDAFGVIDYSQLTKN